MARQLLDTVGVAHGAGEVRDEERARRAEAGDGKAHPDREAPRLPPAGDCDRDKQEDPRVLDARREAGDEPGELDPAADEQRERDGNAKSERHVGDSHPRVGDLGRLDRD